MLRTQKEEGTEIKENDEVCLYMLTSLFDRLLADIRRVSALLIESPLSFGDVFKHISIVSLVRAFSYTFSARVVLNNAMMAALSTSDEETASIALITTLLNSTVLIAMAPLFGIGIEASRLAGEIDQAKLEGDDIRLLERLYAQVALAFANGLLMCGVLSMAMGLAFFFSEFILTQVFRQSSEVAAHAQTFLRPYSPASFAMLLRILCEKFLFGFRYERPTMVMSLSSFAVGMIASIWLGFGGLGIPRVGFAGIAVGTVLEAWLTALLFCLFLGFKPDLQPINFFHLLRSIDGRWKQFLELFWLGLSVLVSIICHSALPVVASAVIGEISTSEQAAWTFVMQLHYLVVIPILAFGDQCYNAVARYQGARLFYNANRMAKFGVLTTLSYVAPVSFIGSAVPWVLSSENSSTVYLLRYLMPIMALAICAESVVYNIMQQLKPLGNKFWSSVISSFWMLVGIAAMLVLSLGFSFGAESIAFCYLGCMVLAACSLFPSWWRRIQPGRLQALMELQQESQGESQPLIDGTSDEVSRIPSPLSTWCSLGGGWQRQVDRVQSWVEHMSQSANDYCYRQ